MNTIFIYIATVIVFFAIDFLWLGTIAKDFYHSQLSGWLRQPFNIPVAVGFYLMYVMGIVYFAINPAIEAGAWKAALLNGALFGFFAYATYDLTNLATLKDWPVKVVIVDMAWGTFITGTSALIGYLIAIKWIV